MTTTQVPVESRIFIGLHKKAIVEQVGRIVDGKPVGFALDCLGTIPAIEISDGCTFYGGYTVDELTEMAVAQEES